MNIQLTFDKLAYVDRLKAAGIDERHARAHAEGLDQALREEVATKADIAELRTEMKAGFTEECDIAKVGVAGGRNAIGASSIYDKADLAALTGRIVRSYIVTAIFLVVSTATIVKFVH
jgi:hypothetical protein